MVLYNLYPSSGLFRQEEFKRQPSDRMETTSGSEPGPSCLLHLPFTPFLSIYKWHIPGRGAMSVALRTVINLSGASCLFQARPTTAVRLTPSVLSGVSVVPGDQQNTERGRCLYN